MSIGSRLKKHFAVVVGVAALIPLAAQAEGLSARDVLAQDAGMSGKEAFAGQHIKGGYNGMGVVTRKNGDVYIGDFSQSRYHGQGICITANGVKKCAGAQVYVGGWKNGKKQGRGTLYDADGKPVWQGKMENDLPVETYPAAAVKDNVRFVVVGLGKDKYIGEVRGGKPDGLGLIVFRNGDMWQSPFRKGKPTEVGLYIDHGGAWETRHIENGKQIVLSSSAEYETLTAEHRANAIANRTSLRQELLQNTLGLMQTTLDLTASIRTAKNSGGGGGGSDGSDGESDGGNVSGGRSSASKSSSGRTCPTCKGSGECRSSSSSASMKYCLGRKTCQYCNGSGTQIHSGEEVACTVCKGSGNCKYCGGRGTCRRCNGSGRQ